VERVGALITDTPYSAKCHEGHDGIIRAAGGVSYEHASGRQQEMTQRRTINYRPWTPSDVDRFVSIWHMKTDGWMVSITDDTLAPAWRAAYERVGRYAFAMIPYVAPGSRVRLAGDGPSSWTCWVMVSRPRRDPYATWGTLPGAYILPSGQGGALPVVGGKPLWLMEQLVKDYSREGDLVCDPCCGAGTTLVAALRSGRRALGGDIDPVHAALAEEWTRHPERPAPSSAPLVAAKGQVALW
jgi:site-specific DNA-methyltransferase (adenine-specific)